ncbi:hypothetical protein B5P45_18690 [Phyllobacterium zundukense]|uniref:Uncharacterized protein n=1 Tax=Phyllobacterium zundukense TaxID=1867719 RepID=A0A2N9VV33_9HYPH|nr:hypothetical protein BLM14_24855 [Phyllobacterium zundukense]PIO43351.1 hypothetical protein B5P45_18690 [Phyllobacterium zundukense]
MFELLGDAIEAGWSKDEILAAIIEVADNTTLAIHQNVLLSVETELKKLKKKADDPAPHPRRHWNRCCYNALDFLQIGREKWVEMNRRWRSFE